MRKVNQAIKPEELQQITYEIRISGKRSVVRKKPLLRPDLLALIIPLVKLQSTER